MEKCSRLALSEPLFLQDWQQRAGSPPPLQTSKNDTDSHFCCLTSPFFRLVMSDKKQKQTVSFSLKVTLSFKVQNLICPKSLLECEGRFHCDTRLLCLRSPHSTLASFFLCLSDFSFKLSTNPAPEPAQHFRPKSSLIPLLKRARFVQAFSTNCGHSTPVAKLYWHIFIPLVIHGMLTFICRTLRTASNAVEWR